MYRSPFPTLVWGISTRGLLRYGVCIPPHNISCAFFEFEGCRRGNKFVESGGMLL